MEFRTLFAILRLAVMAAGLAFGLTGLAHAHDSSDTYEGTLGKYRIVLNLYTTDEGKPAGRYFYQSQGVDITLLPQEKKGHYVEYALKLPDRCLVPDGYWTISIKGDAITGTWRKTPRSSATLAIHLERFTDDCDDIGSQYECLRVDGPIEVIKDSQRTSADGAVTWQKVWEKRSGAEGVELIRAPNAAAMQSINYHDLERDMRSDIQEVLSLRPDGYISAKNTVVMANARLFVVERTYEYNNTYAHEWKSTTYDLVSGNPVNWRAVLKFPGKDTLNFRKDNDIVSLALRQAASHIDGSEGAENENNFCLRIMFYNTCNGDVCGQDASMWHSFVVPSPHKDGLFVAFNSSNYAPSPQCFGTGVTIPWNEVRPLFLKPFPLS